METKSRIQVKDIRNQQDLAGETMDPEIMMNGISREIEAALKAMEKAKTPEEKLIHSKTVKNLCESLGVFLSLVGDMMPFDEDGEPIPF